MTATQDISINVVTADSGAVIKLGPMVTAPQDRVMTDDQLSGFAPESGLNAPFVADLLASFVTHERDGVNLFRMLESSTKNPLLQPKYKQMVDEAEQAVRIWGELIRALGGSDQYASPPARLVETMDSKIVEAFQGTGSADPMSMEMAGVQATVMAAEICLANAGLLKSIGEQADGRSGEQMRAAAEQLEVMSVKHHDWARDMLTTMAVQEAKHSMVQTVGQGAEKMVAKVKNAVT